jgi:hypothetical protein
LGEVPERPAPATSGSRKAGWKSGRPWAIVVSVLREWSGRPVSRGEASPWYPQWRQSSSVRKRGGVGRRRLRRRQRQSGGQAELGLQVARRGFRLPDDDICESKVERDRRRGSQGAACGCREAFPRPRSCNGPEWCGPRSTGGPAGGHSHARFLSGHGACLPRAPHASGSLPEVSSHCRSGLPAAPMTNSSAAYDGSPANASACRWTPDSLSRSALARPSAGEGPCARRWRDWHANDVFP